MQFQVTREQKLFSLSFFVSYVLNALSSCRSVVRFHLFHCALVLLVYVCVCVSTAHIHGRNIRYNFLRLQLRLALVLTLMLMLLAAAAAAAATEMLCGCAIVVLSMRACVSGCLCVCVCVSMRVRACRIQGLSKFLRAASVMIWNVLEFQEVTPDFFIYLNEQRSSAHCAG